MHRFGTKLTDERESRLIRDWWPMDKRRVAPSDLTYLIDSYDDCVASIDEQVGRLWDELGRRKALDRTWIILVADHGESFGEHAGVYLHGSSLYQTELHVPVVVVPPPGTPIRPVVAETVRLRDLAATIDDLAGQGDGPRFPGRSLARLWNPLPGRPAAAEAGEEGLAEVVTNEMLRPLRVSLGSPAMAAGRLVGSGLELHPARGGGPRGAL